MIRRVVIPIFVLALGVAGLVALARTRPIPEALIVEEQVWLVSTAPLKSQTVAPTITLYARVDSPYVSTLTAAVTADVIEVRAREGNDARSGDILVRLDGREADLEVAQRQAEVRELEAELSRARLSHANDQRALVLERKLLSLIRRDVERSEKLATREVGSASRLDEARQAETRQMLMVDTRRLSIDEHDTILATWEARLQRARAVLERARLDAARTVVRAPFAGPVTNVYVSPGARVRAGDRLLTIYDAGQLEFRAQVPTRYVSQLRDSLAAGRAAKARSQVDNTQIRAELDRLDAEMEPGRGGTDAFFRILQSARQSIELGRTIELTVELPPIGNVMTIPQQALYGTDRIYVLEKQRMKSFQIQRTGEYLDGDGSRKLLIQADPALDGAQLIVTQLPNAVDGLRVREVQPR